MTRLRDLLRTRRERLRDLAHVLPAEIAALGLSRGEFRALALMPPEQVARMEAMASINGCKLARLDRERDLRLAVALTCAACASQSRCRGALQPGAPRGDTDFCPNAGTYRMLAAE